MDPHVIFAKSQKGKDEIETRAHHLPSKLRMALILVDGKSDAAHLYEKAGHPELFKTLDELLKLGFIHAASGQARAPLSVSATGLPIKAELIRISRDILGTQADKVVRRIEESPENKEALSLTLRNCIELVRLIVDEKKSLALGVKYSEMLKRG